MDSIEEAEIKKCLVKFLEIGSPIHKIVGNKNETRVMYVKEICEDHIKVIGVSNIKADLHLYSYHIDNMIVYQGQLYYNPYLIGIIKG